MISGEVNLIPESRSDSLDLINIIQIGQISQIEHRNPSPSVG